MRLSWAGSSRPLNEGRGVSPGYRRWGRTGTGTRRRTLNEGRGVSPGYRAGQSRARDTTGTRSTKAGEIPRLQRASRGRRRNRSTALNEGRGVSPGYSRRSAEEYIDAKVLAQRRPGSIPRLQILTVSGLPPSAGAQRRPGSIPRLQSSRRRIRRHHEDAQRRPGSIPRLQVSTPMKCRTPLASAQRRPGSIPRLQGATWPRSARCTRPLNEGRGVSPGYSALGDHIGAAERGRSTKAGEYPPATGFSRRIVAPPDPAQRRPGSIPRLQEPVRAILDAVVRVRSTKAGEYPPATDPRMPDGPRQQRVRSTKAGEYPPATGI